MKSLAKSSGLWVLGVAVLLVGFALIPLGFYVAYVNYPNGHFVGALSFFGLGALWCIGRGLKWIGPPDGHPPKNGGGK
jgi:hypothetical protein